ncbi:hypothetical protein [Nocardia carnea]|uniref:hypothetical protein n=1 Tax=Nocardia carnea TaxID=37328 RepID=UPI002453B16B|nr:hypothetical protein [Nocardia carnea]
MTTPEPSFDVTRGDAAASRHLDFALRILSKHTSDPGLKGLTSDVLSGRLGARDFANTEQVSKALDTTMPALVKRVEALPEKERQRLAEQGEATLERYLRENPEPPPPEPGAAPSEPQHVGLTTPVTAEPPQDAATQSPGRRRQSWRDVVVTPDEPDEDDLYFQERRERGWLQ